MIADDIDILDNAATLLDSTAAYLRSAHKVDPEHPDWQGNDYAKGLHDQARQASEALYVLAARLLDGVQDSGGQPASPSS